MVRFRGLLLVLIGGGIGAFGLWLLYLTMGWAWPDFVPPSVIPDVQGPQGTAQERLTSAPGLAALALLAFGHTFKLLGLGMLILGRRIGLFFSLLVALFAILAVTVLAFMVARPV